MDLGNYWLAALHVFARYLDARPEVIRRRIAVVAGGDFERVVVDASNVVPLLQVVRQFTAQAAGWLGAGFRADGDDELLTGDGVSPSWLSRRDFFARPAGVPLSEGGQRKA